jgi:Na+/melibiose symporter-like transporter
MYYGAINLIRKLSGAIAVFLALQVIGWFGYRTPPTNVAIFQQPAQAITAIRMVSGPLIVVFLIIAIAFAWLYPLNRDRQLRIQISLQNRKHRQNKSSLSNPTLSDNPTDKKY